MTKLGTWWSTPILDLVPGKVNIWDKNELVGIMLSLEDVCPNGKLKQKYE